MAFPPVYLCTDGSDGSGEDCGCGPGKQATAKAINVEMKIEEDVLVLNLFQYGAMPKLGSAKDIAAVKIFVRKKEPFVMAIYNDPMKTALSQCCCGSGCCCCAHGCYC